MLRLGDYIIQLILKEASTLNRKTGVGTRVVNDKPTDQRNGVNEKLDTPTCIAVSSDIYYLQNIIYYFILLSRMQLQTT